MRILVRSPLLADRVRETLESYDADDGSFTFIETAGGGMVFEVTGTDDGVALAKSTIRSTDFGKGLFFSVVEAS
ncbi:MAG: hypothetical protein FWD41_03975 [Actinomycetia bacterium]|nr:hypothetical protein [Actinomycetes bacterium]